jgi:hypothetical protein
VTIGITTFLRRQSLLRLEESIRRFYPDLPIVVVDTESNLSRGRNRLARRVTTPLLFLCEDDFEFCERTRIEPLLDVLRHDTEIAGVGGELLEPHGRIWAQNYTREGDDIVTHPSTEPLRRTPTGVIYRPCQLIFNLGLFRCDLFRHVLWDEDMPVNEHVDYYWRVSTCSRWRMAVADGFAIVHHMERSDPEYCRFRWRDYRGAVDAKHGAHFRTGNDYVWPKQNHR